MVARKLPRKLDACKITVLNRNDFTGKIRATLVRKKKVEAALKWLKEHNRHYAHVEIDYDK